MSKPNGFCLCGCGGRTSVITKTNTKRGHVRGEYCRYIVGHWLRGRTGSDSPSFKTGRSKTGHGYVVALGPDGVGHRLEHIRIAEAALGKPLPPKAVVHHVNGIRDDNRPQNLVVCEDTAYHMLLHRRQRALDACGHPDWVKCEYCPAWTPEDDSVHDRRLCRNRYLAKKNGRATARRYVDKVPIPEGSARCRLCHEVDLIENLWVHPTRNGMAHHRACNAAKEAARKARKAQAAGLRLGA